MLRTLAKLRIQEINNQCILAPVTKEQRIIFESFNICADELALL